MSSVDVRAARAHAVNSAMLAVALAALVVDVVVAHGLLDLVALALPVSFLAVGWLVLRRYPDNVEGRLLLGAGLAWAVAIDLQLAGAWVLPIGLMGTHLLLRYPDGRLPSRTTGRNTRDWVHER